MELRRKLSDREIALAEDSLLRLCREHPGLTIADVYYDGVSGRYLLRADSEFCKKG